MTHGQHLSPLFAGKCNSALQILQLIHELRRQGPRSWWLTSLCVSTDCAQFTLSSLSDTSTAALAAGFSDGSGSRDSSCAWGWVVGVRPSQGRSHSLPTFSQRATGQIPARWGGLVFLFFLPNLPSEAAALEKFQILAGFPDHISHPMWVLGFVSWPTHVWLEITSRTFSIYRKY